MRELLQDSGEKQIIPGANWRDTAGFLLQITDKEQKLKCSNIPPDNTHKAET